jgi:hypothetical protein
MENNSRRDFLKNVAVAAAAVPLAGLLGQSTEAFAKDKAPVAPPAGTTPLSESDSVASALGYHQNAKDTDFEKYPARKLANAKNQICKTCSQYTALNAGWGNCQMLTAGVVAAGGWCSSWNSKT